MLDYATRRLEAGKWIEKFMSSVKVSDISTIEYNIGKNFGLGSLYVKKQLLILQDIGLVKFNAKEKVVYWIEQPKPPQEVKEDAEIEFFLKEQQYTPAATEEPIPKSREKEDAANP